MTAPYTITDEEFEKLLQDVNDFPSSIDNPGLGLDFSVLPTIDDIDTMTSLCGLPTPPLNNNCLSHSRASSEDDDIRVHQTQKKIDCLQVEVDYLRSLVDHLTTYLNSLRPWMMEVTEALDKLGEAPASATELEFNVD